MKVLGSGVGMRESLTAGSLAFSAVSLSAWFSQLTSPDTRAADYFAFWTVSFANYGFA